MRSADKELGLGIVIQQVRRLDKRGNAGHSLDPHIFHRDRKGYSTAERITADSHSGGIYLRLLLGERNGRPGIIFLTEATPKTAPTFAHAPKVKFKPGQVPFSEFLADGVNHIIVHVAAIEGMGMANHHQSEWPISF